MLQRRPGTTPGDTRFVASVAGMGGCALQRRPSTKPGDTYLVRYGLHADQLLQRRPSTKPGDT